MLSPYAERVLAVVEAIPAGRVMSYGDICEYLGESSARAVGMVLFAHGSEVAWHRVVMTSGAPAPQHAAEQLTRLRSEGVRLRAGGQRVDMTAARWDGH